MTTHIGGTCTARDSSQAVRPAPRGARLTKHADYQRVYKSSRKQFSSSMAYFFCLRTSSTSIPNGPRVGLTAGKVLGNAVTRNRIKRRMREAVRRHVSLLAADVDVILHPRKSVLALEFSHLDREVERLFAKIALSLCSPRIAPAVEPRPRPGA